MKNHFKILDEMPVVNKPLANRRGWQDDIKTDLK
jgi:hypothetical protein